MVLLRIGVILWLFLPLIVLVINRLWQAFRLSKYPSACTARIVDASYSNGGGATTGTTLLSYAYRVMYIDYTARASLAGKERKVGQDIPIRYNPSQPAQSIVWEPAKRSEWLFAGLLWVSASLGSDVFIIFISLFALVLFITQSRAVRGVKMGRLPGSCTLSLLLVLFLLMLALGIGSLVRDGFWGQNFLRTFWDRSAGISWTIVIRILEQVIFFLVLGVLGIIFPLLVKKLGFWLTSILLVIFFLALIFAYAYLKIVYIEPLLPPQA